MVGRSSVARWELMEAEREKVNPRVEREKPRVTEREGEWIGGGGQCRSEGRSRAEIELVGVLGGRTGARTDARVQLEGLAWTCSYACRGMGHYGFIMGHVPCHT
ncbi:hypothetical protein RJT34_27578 [Clitoria ternatea]|uniref:Uncharacterized protein n=1 Tax=Clitoria ternatea TaxID=43366 RepID=A0AAN9I8K9_CLITE